MRGNRRQKPDRISALPEDTIEKILTHMPIRDALRTSILSKKWRYCWTTMPKLVFDDNMVTESSDSEENNDSKLAMAMFHVLLLHRVPISELSICITDTEFDDHNEIDQIILYLSWNKDINKFVLEISSMYEYYYKLPCSFYSLKGLEHLSLKYCELKLPSTFNGFRLLKSVIFYQVDFSANVLQRFLTTCPLLVEFTLIGYHEFTDVTGESKDFTFVELFKCLPLVQVVTISWTYNEHFAAGGMSQKLPTSLVYLRILVLEVRFFKQDQLSSTVHVINSSPNLEKIQMTMVRHVGQTVTTLLDPQDYLDLISLNHLKELEIIRFHNYAPEMEFVKLIMANSPVLKKTRIELSKFVSLDEENKMLRHLLLHPFPRASPSANFIIERPKLPMNAN